MPFGMLGEMLTNEQVTTMLTNGWNQCPECGELFWFPRKGIHNACRALKHPSGKAKTIVPCQGVARVHPRACKRIRVDMWEIAREALTRSRAAQQRKETTP